MTRRRQTTQTTTRLPSSSAKDRSFSVDEIRSIAGYTSYGHSHYMKDQAIVSEYGATPEILVALWDLLRPYLEQVSEPQHMLWWLYNCKHYPTKLLLEKAIRVSAPTSRKYMEPIKKAFLKVRNKVVRGKRNIKLIDLNVV